MAYREEDYFTENFAAKILQDVVIDRNIIYPIFEFNGDEGTGFGFFSIIMKIKAKGKNQEKSFIVKAAQQNKHIRKISSVRLFFLQEIKYYKDIFPAFEKFQRTRNIKFPFKAYPKCYKTMDTELNELLVLENLNSMGYEVLDASRRMDESHIKIVLREYGKLHAISLAMKDQNFENFQKLVKDIINPFSAENISCEFLDLYKNAVIMTKAAFNPLTESKILKALTDFSENIIEVFKALDNYKGKSSVIIHGDCWNNNMMFKYQNEDLTRPIDVRFFDFQLGKLCTPVIDISYFLYSSMSEAMLKNLNHYLKIYHDSLRDHMNQMGSDVDKYYPFDSLIKEWKTYCKFGVMLSTVIYRVVLRDNEEATALMDTPENISLVNTFLKKSKNEDLINQRYRSLVLHLFENGFI